MNNKFKRDQYVDFNIQGKVITFCKITAVKDCETGYRYDLIIDNIKMYDISEDLLTDKISEQTQSTLNQKF